MKNILVLFFALMAVALARSPPKPATNYQAHNTMDVGNFVATMMNQDTDTGIIAQSSNGNGNSNIFEANNKGGNKSFNGNAMLSNQLIAGNLQDVERSDKGTIVENQKTNDNKGKNRIIDNYNTGATGSNANHEELGLTNVDNMDATAKSAKGKNKINQEKDNNWGRNYFGTD